MRTKQSDDGGSSSSTISNSDWTVLQGIIRFLIFLIVLPLLMCGVAGRWMWWQAYFVVSLYVLISIPAFLHRPFLNLAQERARFIKNPGTAGFDKVLAPLAVIFTFLAYLAAGLQHRLQPDLLSGPFGNFCSHVGVMLVAGITDALSLLFISWCMAVNAWFSSVVRIQSNRGHKVCSSGAYKYVRHPGYVGFVVQGFAEAVLLQSSWTATLAVMRTILLAVRSVKEEQFLMAHLPGYPAYATQVHYREEEEEEEEAKHQILYEYLVHQRRHYHAKSCNAFDDA
eukprot:gene12592-12724_t